MKRAILFMNKTPAVLPPNTFIGGVSATIGTAALLSTKLGISVANISNFSVVGSDIQCRITGSYAIPAAAFSTFVGSFPNVLTYYIDNDNLVTSIGQAAFFYQTNFNNFKLNAVTTLSSYQCFIGNASLKIISLPALTTIIDYQNLKDCTSSEIIYIPLCTTIGSSHSVDNGNFGSIKTGTKIYAHPSMATINAGGVEADLAAAIVAGNTVTYVSNFTSPNPVTTLVAGTIYKTAVQLNFTAPISTNTIEYYELYKNGVLQTQKITATGQYVTGLTASTAYDFTIIAVDVFFNKSIVSNNLSASTNTASAQPTTGLISYYKLDANSNDSQGSNNGTDTAVTYAAGKVSNAATYNGTTSKSIIGNPANLQLATGSISCWIKTSGAGGSYRSIFGKTLAYNMFLKDNVLIIYNWGTFGGAGDRTTSINLADNAWHHIAFIFESGTANNFLYIDGVLRLTFSMSMLNQTDNVCIGASNSVQNFNGTIDEASIYNVKLSKNNIDLIYNAGIGITL